MALMITLASPDMARPNNNMRYTTHLTLTSLALIESPYHKFKAIAIAFHTGLFIIVTLFHDQSSTSSRLQPPLSLSYRSRSLSQD